MRNLTFGFLILLLAPIAMSAELTVPGDHATISAAVAAAAAGDTITVAAGNYAENVTLDKYLILNGAGESLADTVIDGTVEVTGSGLSMDQPLTISNLRVQPSATGAGLLFNSVSANILVENVTSTTAGGDSGHYAIHFQGLCSVTNVRFESVSASYSLAAFRVATTGSVNNLTISNCDFSESVYGLLVFASNGVPDNATDFGNIRVEKTRFFHNKDKGVYLEKIHNGVITQCDFDSNGDGSAHWSPYVDGGSVWDAGIDLNLKFGTYSNFRFLGNTITNCGAGGDPDKGAGALIKARDDGGTYGAHPAALNGVEIRGNVFSGNSFYDLRFGELNKLATSLSGTVVRNNSFSATPTGDSLDNHGATTVDARYNYWGTADGSSANGGTGQGVNVILGGGAVDSSQHLTLGDADLTKDGFQQAKYVDDDWAAIGDGVDPDGAGPAVGMGIDSFASIIDVVDAVAPGDSVTIYNGTYPHFQTVVDVDDVTLTGESRAGVMVVPAIVDTKEQDPQVGTVVVGFVVDANDVTISTMTINGEGNNAGLGQAAGDNNFRIGIVNNPASVSHRTSVVDCDIRGVVYDGITLGSFSPLVGKSSSMSVDNCDISDVTYGHGVSMAGSGSVTDSTMDDIGSQPLPSGLRGTGIQLSGGPFTITGNTISNFTSIGIGNDTSAFVGPHVLTIQDNTIESIQDGNFTQGEFGIRIVGADAGSEIGGTSFGEGNTIDLSGNDTTRRRWGIMISYSGDDVAGDVIVGMNTVTMEGEGTGILLHHNDDLMNPVQLIQNTITSTNPTNMGGWQGFGILSNDDGDMFFPGYDSDGENHSIMERNEVSGFLVGIAANVVGDTTLAGGRTQAILMRNNNRVFNNTTGFLILDSDGATNGYRADVIIETSGLEAYNNTTGILLDGGRLFADQISARDNSGHGISIVNEATTFQLEESVFTNNDIGIFLNSTAAQAAMTGNDFTGNTSFGLNNVSGNPVSAANGFWGDVSGPTHASNVGGTGAAVSDDVTFLPFIGLDPVEPTLTSTAPRTVDVLATYSHTITFTGNPLPTLSVTGLPAWLSFDAPTATISGTPGLGDAGFTDPIEIRASSSYGPDAIDYFQIEVLTEAPMITSTPSATASVSSLYTYNIAASGVPNASFSVMGLPAWLSFDGGSVISGTPSFGDIGTTGMITITATNGIGMDAQQSFQITVSGVPPTITSIPVSIADAGATYVYIVTTTGSPAPTITVQGLPAWMSFNGSNTLSGTPSIADAGDNGIITIMASNGVGTAAVQTYAISVQAIPPTLLAPPPSTHDITAPFSHTLQITGVPNATMTVSNLPSWMSFDGMRTLSGNPTAEDVGSYEYSITIDNGVAAPETIVLNIDVSDPDEVRANGGRDDRGCSLNSGSSTLPFWLMVILVGVIWRRRQRIACGLDN